MRPVAAPRRGRRTGPLLAAAALALAPAVAGCSSPSTSTTYSYRTGGSPVDVDTAALRALKASADIAPCPTGTGFRPSAEGDRALPSITLPCLGGGSDVDLAGLRGPLLLNFWAQTCTFCREESPLLQELSERAEGKVAVVGVDFYDPRPSWALGFAKQYGLTYPQIADPLAVTKWPFHIAGLPVTVFVDGAGDITYSHPGQIKSAAELSALVRRHLGVSVSLPDGR